MIDFHLIYDIALGDIEFQKSILTNFEKDSREFMGKSDVFSEKNRWVSIHILAKGYRNKISPLLTPDGLEKVNSTMQILISPLNNSAKSLAYQSLSSIIRRQLSGMNHAA